MLSTIQQLQTGSVSVKDDEVTNKGLKNDEGNTLDSDDISEDGGFFDAFTFMMDDNATIFTAAKTTTTITTVAMGTKLISRSQMGNLEE